MNPLKHQQGAGLIEVLVAMLLLSIAVLGFSALQVKAISATDESLVRTKSLTIIRNLAEVMRAYPEAYVTGSGTAFTASSSSVTAANPTVQAVASSQDIVTGEETVTIDGEDITRNSCLSTGEIKNSEDPTKKVPNQSCNINQLAARDALMIKKMAADEEINLAIETCPGTTVQSIQQQMCIITAWSDTKALLDDTDKQACANANGVYNRGSHCIISEAY